MSTKVLKICPKGHKFSKSSDCPVCPICTSEDRPESGFLSAISAPARRALASKEITTLAQLASFTEKEIANLHGMGPSVLSKLAMVLTENKLSFKKSKN
jgi:hypothetical protein